MDISISELARMVGGEKALTEECGDLLSKTYSSQVDDDSSEVLYINFLWVFQSSKVFCSLRALTSKQ